MKMKTVFQLFFLCLAAVLLFACGTTGKNVETDLTFSNNSNCIINVSPEVVTKSGDSKTTSANTTETKDLLDLEVPVEEVMGAVIEKGVDAELLKGLVPEPDVIPEVSPPDVAGDSLGSWGCKPYTRISGNPKSTCRIATDFKKHTYPVTFVFDNNCGSFSVPSGVGRYEDLANGKEDYVYYDYEKGTPAVFTQAGCVASKVEAFKVAN